MKQCFGNSQTRSRRQSIAVWCDDESRDLRRRSRVFEKRYRRSGLAEDRIVWVRHERERQRSNRTKEENYWQMCVSANTGQPRKLWKVFSSMMVRGIERNLQHLENPRHRRLCALIISSRR